MKQYVIFEMHLTAVDKPTDRRRWNGEPMASAETGAALFDAVDAASAALAEHGFELVHTGYGVTANEAHV
jgi:hypothetical protein